MSGKETISKEEFVKLYLGASDKVISQIEELLKLDETNKKQNTARALDALHTIK